MKKLLLISVLIVAIIILIISYKDQFLNKNIDKAHWEYEGDNGPQYWGSIKEEFKMCSQGKMQTPINIIPTDNINLKPLKFNYNTSASDLINNGHTVQINIVNGSSVKIDNIKYELKQFHFHTPSENNINGKSYPLESHFVHASKDGRLAVVAIMFEEGEENPILKKIWSKFSIIKKNIKIPIELTSNDIENIMPTNKAYYKFMGSLTTPPCSENVKWNVFKVPVKISKKQIQQFFNIFGHTNNRPIQPTDNRKILE